MDTINLKIEGMTCMGCVASVTRLLKSQPGVTDASVTLTPGEARIQFDGGLTDANKLKCAVEDAGYGVT